MFLFNKKLFLLTINTSNFELDENVISLKNKLKKKKLRFQQKNHLISKNTSENASTNVSMTVSSNSLACTPTHSTPSISNNTKSIESIINCTSISSTGNHTNGRRIIKHQIRNTSENRSDGDDDGSIDMNKNQIEFVQIIAKHTILISFAIFILLFIVICIFLSIIFAEYLSWSLVLFNIQRYFIIFERYTEVTIVYLGFHQAHNVYLCLCKCCHLYCNKVCMAVAEEKILIYRRQVLDEMEADAMDENNFRLESDNKIHFNI